MKGNKYSKQQSNIDYNCKQLETAGLDYVRHDDGIMLRATKNTWVWIPIDVNGRIQDFKAMYDYTVVTEMPKNPSEAKRLMDKNNDDIEDILESIII